MFHWTSAALHASWVSQSQRFRAAMARGLQQLDHVRLKELLESSPQGSRASTKGSCSTVYMQSRMLA